MSFNWYQNNYSNYANMQTIKKSLEENISPVVRYLYKLVVNICTYNNATITKTKEFKKQVEMQLDEIDTEITDLHTILNDVKEMLRCTRLATPHNISITDSEASINNDVENASDAGNVGDVDNADDNVNDVDDNVDDVDNASDGYMDDGYLDDGCANNFEIIDS